MVWNTAWLRWVRILQPILQTPPILPIDLLGLSINMGAIVVQYFGNGYAKMLSLFHKASSLKTICVFIHLCLSSC